MKEKEVSLVSLRQEITIFVLSIESTQQLGTLKVDVNLNVK